MVGHKMRHVGVLTSINSCRDFPFLPYAREDMFVCRAASVARRFEFPQLL